MKLKICELVKGKINDYKARGPINIAIIGDSVSHGCFRTGELDYDAVYHNLLRRKINGIYPSIPVNVINTAIGGTDAGFALKNFDRDVLPHKPDLVIICFGLNDVNGELEAYEKSLEGLFKKCRDNGFDCIFMTPNMLNTRFDERAPEEYYDYAKITMKLQNSGKMDMFMECARATAKGFDIPVADAYAKWKAMAAAGIDTTELLTNYINHPTREMHTLFADTLFDCIFGEKETAPETAADDGMIKL